jgi:RNA polymerase sigma-70 factor (ECF subfamily)
VRRHERRVRSFLARLCRGAGADDLAQETFLTAWRKAAAYRGEGSYEGWLLRIAWRTFLSHQRSARTELEAEPEAHGSIAGPQGEALDIERALGRLSAAERAAALLCYSEGCSHAEAARILEMPLGTLKSTVARARSRLAQSLEGYRP